MLDHLPLVGKTRLLRLAIVTVALLILTGLNEGVASAAEPSNCVTYLKNGLGLIPMGPWSAADYGPTLQNIGYKKLDGPKWGSLMVFGREVLDSGTDGHIALVRSAAYDEQTSSWTIRVQHARWTVGAIIDGVAPCTAWGSVRLTTFSVSSLNGLGFYRLPAAVRAGLGAS